MSNKGAIVVEQIAVRRSVAGELEGLTLDGLSPGINVVFGPNASGKSTLASLIHTLLWPEGGERDEASLMGRIRVGDSAWRIEYDGGRVLRRNEEGSGTDPQVPPASSSDRYQLCLHDLLESDGASFAQFILRESVGGFDVEEAARTLGFEEPTLRVRKATRKVEGARRKWEEARGEQRELQRREEKLDEWNRRLEEVEEAARRAEAVAKAVELLKIERHIGELRAELDAFPEAMEQVRGDEMEVLEGAGEKVREAEEKLRDAKGRIRKLEGALEENVVAERHLRHLPAQWGRVLGDYVQQLEVVERGLVERRREKAEKKRCCERLWWRAGGRIDEESAPEFDADTLDEVLRLARETEGFTGRRGARQELEELVGDAEAPEALEEMRRGITLLRRWLSSSGGEVERQDAVAVQWVALASAVGLVGVAAIAAVAIHPLAVVLLLFAFAVAWIFWRTRQAKKGSERRKVYRRDFERICLASPSSWSEEAVEERLEELVEDWARGCVEAEKARWWRERRGDRGLEQLEREVDDKRRELEVRLGITVAGDGAGAYVIAEQIYRWQVARDEVAQLEAVIEELEKEHDELSEKVESTLELVGFEPIEDAAHAKAQVHTLEEAVRDFEVQSERLERARQKLETAEEEKESGEKRRAELLERLGAEDEFAVKQLCDQKGAYDALVDELGLKKRQAAAMLATLESLEGFSEDLLETSVEKLESKAERLCEEAKERDKILQTMESIRTEIRAAKESVDAERKWAEYRRLCDDLRRQRRCDVGRAVGAAIAEYVRRESRERSRPKVFRRARQLFAAITRGRYRLDLVDDEGEARFVAVDERENTERALDELSSGTRVQLLMAVRVAFVECVERGSRVPLVLDEALANSDDVRARAIVEAVERIAAEGRQIFYFTAQSDEVRTWEELIDGSEVDGTVVELGALVEATVGGEAKKRYGQEVAPPEHEPVPDPGGVSHEEYGEVLGVDEGISPWASVGELHLWIVVEDVKMLHRLLREGISRWGQLRNLARYGGLDAVGLSDEEYERIKVRIRALEALKNARAVGRGRPVNRRVLEESGAVSETFIDRVEEVCEAVEGDALELIEALEKGEVKRFRSAKIEELRHFLEAREYLDDEEPLRRDEVWIRVKASVSSALAKGVVSDRELRRLVRRAMGKRVVLVESPD